MAETKDKLITAESLKCVYDLLTEKIDTAATVTNIYVTDKKLIVRAQNATVSGQTLKL